MTARTGEISSAAADPEARRPVRFLQGPYLRRFQPRAQGRAYAIRKPTCSISIKMKSHETSKRARPPIKLGSN